MYCPEKTVTTIHSSLIIIVLVALHAVFIKAVPIELTVPGICKANVLIWFKFHEALPPVTQHSV
jgi:hypothetical protein